jgi:hypothetical protein
MGLVDYTISDKRYFNSGREHERNRIIKHLTQRIEDFKLCSKNDSCKDHIYVLEGLIQDIKNDELLGGR